MRLFDSTLQVMFLLFAIAVSQTAYADQDDVTKAIDSTATQWSFQFAYQVNPDYHNDTLPNGNTDYPQVRAVMPLMFDSFTVLPRLTIRH